MGKYFLRHSGLDIAVPRGTPVKAANNGVIRLSMMLTVTGNTIIIDHGCNIYSSYAHLDKLLVQDGAEVKKGDIICPLSDKSYERIFSSIYL